MLDGDLKRCPAIWEVPLLTAVVGRRGNAASLDQP